MKINRKLVAIAAAVVVVAAGGVGIAYAVGGGESDEQITGPSAKKAEAAALDAVGGGPCLRPSTRKPAAPASMRSRSSGQTARRSRSLSTTSSRPSGRGTSAEDEGAEDESTEGAED